MTVLDRAVCLQRVVSLISRTVVLFGSGRRANRNEPEDGEKGEE